MSEKISLDSSEVLYEEKKFYQKHKFFRFGICSSGNIFCSRNSSK